MQTLSFILAVTTFLTVGVLPASSISMSGTRQEKRQGEGSESILKPRAIERHVTSYHKLERALVANKIAFINLDWRGIGKSTNKGSLVDMPLTEMPKALDDVREAYKFLSSRNEIDPERIGVLGSAYGAKLAMNAAKDNSKLKAIVMLTPVVKPQDLAGDRETIAAINRPVFLVTGDGFGDSTRKFVEIVTASKRNVVKTYPER